MKTMFALLIAFTFPLSPFARAELAPNCQAAYEKAIQNEKAEGIAVSAFGGLVGLGTVAALLAPIEAPRAVVVSAALSAVTTFFGLATIHSSDFYREVLKSVAEAEAFKPGPALKSLAGFLTTHLNETSNQSYSGCYSNCGPLPYDLNEVQKLEVMQALRSNRVSAEQVGEATRWLVAKQAMCTPDRSPLDSAAWLRMMAWALTSPQDVETTTAR